MERTTWIRVVGVDGGVVESLCMAYDGFEVFDAYDYVELFLGVEMLEVEFVDGDCCFEWVLQYLYGHSLASFNVE